VRRRLRYVLRLQRCRPDRLEPDNCCIGQVLQFRERFVPVSALLERELGDGTRDGVVEASVQRDRETGALRDECPFW
jgi:hypothetical protein